MVNPVFPGDADSVLAAVEQLPTAVWVYRGPDHVFVAVNAEARRVLGDRPLLGRAYRDAVPDTEGQRGVELLDQVYQSGSPVSGREWRYLLDEPGHAVREIFLSFTTVPVRDEAGTVIGCATTGVDVTAEVTAREAARAQAGQAEQRLRAARDVAMALQGSLLPDSLPVLPGLRLAAHYLVAGSEQAAGGDWFDAVPLPDGAVALVVGDVVGHGPKASAAMGQLRAVLTALLLDGHGVADTLTRLGRFVTRVPSAMATTVCLAVLDPVTGEVQYACSGHPPPLLLGADGRTRYLPVHQGAPLGTSGAPPEVAKARLDPGEVLMLFTDGLVERPGRSLPDGLDQLRGYAADALRRGPDHMMTGPGIDRVCRLSLERMTRDGYPDDVSLIAAQRVRPVSPLGLELAALPAVLAELRAELGRWLEALGADQRDTSAVQLAIGEAVTNTIEHAYPDGAGSVRVEGRLDPDGRVVLTVTDRGRWRPPPSEPSGRGRGLIMVRGSMDTAEIEAGADGTVVTMGRRLHRAPVVAPGQPLPARPVGVVAEPPLAVRASRGPQPMLEVTGPVDAHTVTEFRRRLTDACRGGTLPLDLDLTGVTHLGSVGVQALHELAGQMATEAQPLRVIAPALCPAYAVLELTGLTRLVAPTEAPPEDNGLRTGVA